MTVDAMKWPQGLVSRPERPASDAELDALAGSVFAPLSTIEIEEQITAHKTASEGNCIELTFEPSSWQLPKRHLPASYLAFLRYSNGGFFEGAHRNFDPLFSTNELREYMLAYGIPSWMPLSLPIGFDGGGSFYLLDMRNESINNDYPVLFVHADNLGYDEAITLARSFSEFIETRLGPV